jgi:hypothetical protein
MSGRYPNEQWYFSQRQSQAYKGYLIVPLMGGSWSITKDRYHISYATDVDNAKRTIDQLV